GEDVYIRSRGRRMVSLHARPVHNCRTTYQGRRSAPHLHGLFLPVSAIRALDHRQGTANLSWHTLDVRKCSARLAYPRLWAEWAFHPDAPSGEEVPLHLSWIWHHADDVHASLAIRLRPWG